MTGPERPQNDQERERPKTDGGDGEFEDVLPEGKKHDDQQQGIDQRAMEGAPKPPNAPGRRAEKDLAARSKIIGESSENRDAVLETNRRANAKIKQAAENQQVPLEKLNPALIAEIRMREYNESVKNQEKELRIAITNGVSLERKPEDTAEVSARKQRKKETLERKFSERDARDLVDRVVTLERLPEGPGKTEVLQKLKQELGRELGPEFTEEDINALLGAAVVNAGKLQGIRLQEKVMIAAVLNDGKHYDRILDAIRSGKLEEVNKVMEDIIQDIGGKGVVTIAGREYDLLEFHTKNLILQDFVQEVRAGRASILKDKGIADEVKRQLGAEGGIAPEIALAISLPVLLDIASLPASEQEKVKTIVESPEWSDLKGTMFQGKVEVQPDGSLRGTIEGEEVIVAMEGETPVAYLEAPRGRIRIENTEPNAVGFDHALAVKIARETDTHSLLEPTDIRTAVMENAGTRPNDRAFMSRAKAQWLREVMGVIFGKDDTAEGERQRLHETKVYDEQGTFQPKYLNWLTKFIIKNSDTIGEGGNLSARITKKHLENAAKRWAEKGEYFPLDLTDVD